MNDPRRVHIKWSIEREYYISEKSTNPSTGKKKWHVIEEKFNNINEATNYCEAHKFIYIYH